METIIKELLSKHPEQFYIILGLISLLIFLNYLTKNNQFFKGILKIDYEKRMQRLGATSKLLKSENSELKDAIDHQIGNLAFINFTGFKLAENKRALFLRLFNHVKNDLDLESIKILFLNSSIKENELIVKITRSTRTQLVIQIIQALLMFLAFAVLLYLSFLVPRNIAFGKIFFSIISIGFFLSGLYHLIDNIVKRNDLKRIKNKYNGIKIK